MSTGWNFSVSSRVMEFVSAQDIGERRKLLLLLRAMAAHPSVRPDDQGRKDEGGRQLWLRFQDGFAIIFWLDHAEREVRIVDVGFD